MSFLYLAFLESSYDALVQKLQNGFCVGWEELELNMAKAKFMNKRWGVVKEYQDVAFLFIIVELISRIQVLIIFYVTHAFLLDS